MYISVNSNTAISVYRRERVMVVPTVDDPVCVPVMSKPLMGQSAIEY